MPNRPVPHRTTAFGERPYPNALGGSGSFFGRFRKPSHGSHSSSPSVSANIAPEPRARSSHDAALVLRCCCIRSHRVFPAAGLEADFARLGVAAQIFSSKPRVFMVARWARAAFGSRCLRRITAHARAFAINLGGSCALPTAASAVPLSGMCSCIFDQAFGPRVHILGPWSSRNGPKR
jgi:hypothetical protein